MKILTYGCSKCPVCGNPIEQVETADYCPYCGWAQTYP